MGTKAFSAIKWYWICAGNKNGLLLPNTATDQGKPFVMLHGAISACLQCLPAPQLPSRALHMLQELMHLCKSPLELLRANFAQEAGPKLLLYYAELMHVRNSLPDEVVVQRIDERLNSLGNCISCNDYVALVHPDIDKVHIPVILPLIRLSFAQDLSDQLLTDHGTGLKLSECPSQHRHVEGNGHDKELSARDGKGGLPPCRRQKS